MKKCIIFTIIFILLSSMAFAEDKTIKFSFKGKEIYEKSYLIPKDSLLNNYILSYIKKDQIFIIARFENLNMSELISFSIKEKEKSFEQIIKEILPQK